MKEIIGLDIIPEVEVIEYFGPSTFTSPFILRGKVRVVVSGTLRIKRLTVKFDGTNRLQMNKLIEGYLEGPLSLMQNRIESYQWVLTPIIHIEIVLCDVPTILTSGVNDLPFEVTLPADLPASYKHDFASLDYELAAVVVPVAILSKAEKFRRAIPVVRHLLPNIATANLSNLRKQYSGRRDGVVTYQVDTPKVICVEQGEATISLSLGILSLHGRPKDVAVILEQNIDGRFHSKDKSRPALNVPCSQVERQIIQPVTSYSRALPPTSFPDTTPIEVSLPVNLSDAASHHQLRPNLDSPLLDVTYQFRIRVAFVDETEREMTIVFPVAITSIPSDPPPLPEDLMDPDVVFGLPAYEDVLSDPVILYEALPSVLLV